MPQEKDSMISAAIPALISYGVYANLKGSSADPTWLYFSGGCAAFFGTVAAYRFARDWGIWFAAKQLAKPIGIYGATRGLNEHDPREFGLKTTNESGDGLFLGMKSGDAKPMPLFYDGDSHGLVVAGTGGGKTSSLSKPMRLSLGAHRNAIITAKGEDMAVSLHRFLTEELGQEVVCIDPYRLMKRHGIKSDDYNPCDVLVALANESSPEIFEKAHEIALVLLPEHSPGGGENKIFRDMGRGFIAFGLIFLAIEQVSTGELCCNLAYLNRLLNEGTDELAMFFGRMAACPDYDGAVARAGRRMLSKFKKSAKSAENFITESQVALQIFEPVTHIGKSVEYTTFNPADLKTPGKKITIFIILPPEKSQLTSTYIGLCLNMLLVGCIEVNRFEPRVTVLADEFENIAPGPLPIVERVLKIGRTRGVQLWAFAQAMQGGLEAKYGDLAPMFFSQTAVQLLWDIRNVDEAEKYSKRAGKVSFIKPHFGPAQDLYDQRPQEEPIDYIRIDELAQMPKFKSILFFEQNPPMMLDLVHYNQCAEWSELVDSVPGAPAEPEFARQFSIAPRELKPSQLVAAARRFGHKLRSE